jgi:hypothetical protein
VKDKIIDNVIILIMSAFTSIFIMYIGAAILNYNPDKVDDFKTWQTELYQQPCCNNCQCGGVE